jgi:hypothetical protein
LVYPRVPGDGFTYARDVATPPSCELARGASPPRRSLPSDLADHTAASSRKLRQRCLRRIFVLSGTWWVNSGDDLDPKTPPRRSADSMSTGPMPKIAMTTPTLRIDLGKRKPRQTTHARALRSDCSAESIMTEPITDERNRNRRGTTLRTVGVAKDTRLRGAVCETGANPRSLG